MKNLLDLSKECKTFVSQTLPYEIRHNALAANLGIAVGVSNHLITNIIDDNPILQYRQLNLIRSNDILDRILYLIVFDLKEITELVQTVTIERSLFSSSRNYYIMYHAKDYNKHKLPEIYQKVLREDFYRVDVISNNVCKLIDEIMD